MQTIIARTITMLVLLVACAAPAPAVTTAPESNEPTTPLIPGPSATPTSAPTPSAAASAAVVDPQTVNPCDLLTAADVSLAIGSAADAGVATDSLDGKTSLCFFHVPAWPAAVAIPENPGVFVRVWRESKTVATAEIYGNFDQGVIAEVADLGDAAWWSVHQELPNVHINTEDAALDIVTAPLQVRVGFTQIPNPVGVDKGAWLADATELAEKVLAALGR